MKNLSRLLALPLLTAALLPLPASADGDAAFDRMADSYRGATLHPAVWHNRLLPDASGDSHAASAGSADTQFMRSIAYYTRAMLDRAGWVNPYAPAPGYASGNYLLAVRIGDGVTQVTLA